MTRQITLAALAVAMTLGMAATSNAQVTYVAPETRVVPTIGLPKFGFESYNIRGYGERVTFVRCHSLAERLGLEPGDTIVSMNGIPLTYHGSWNNALRRAVFNGGWVHLDIRDTRSGRIVHREAYVGHRHDEHVHITPKSRVVEYHSRDRHYVQPTPRYPQDPHFGAPGPITPKSKKFGPNNKFQPKTFNNQGNNNLQKAAFNYGMQQISKKLNKD